MLNNIIKLVFPPKCIFCGHILHISAGVEICEACRKRIPYLSEMSGRVLNKSRYIDDIVCVCEYSGIIKDSLIRFKFFNKPGYYRSFAKLLAEKVKKMTNYCSFDIIISVPLYKKKENTRGYNQAMLISEVLGRELGIRGSRNLLLRNRDTHPQSLLPRADRLSNVRDAFSVSEPEAAADKSILLVDDIMTTGCTLEECAKALKEAGAARVTAAVIASGRKF